MFVINICERPLFKESYTTPDGSCNNIYILFGKGKRKVMTVQNHSEHTGGGKNCRLNWPETRAPHPFERCKSPKRTCQNLHSADQWKPEGTSYIHTYFFEIWTCSTHTHWIQTKTHTHKHRRVVSVLVSTVRQRAITRLVSGLNFWLYSFTQI